jgi:hypothetical protein
MKKYMEQKWRLKKEARQFFEKRGFVNNRLSLCHWMEHHKIPEELLEMVENCHVTFGHDSVSEYGTRSSSLSGWKSDGKTAHFQFTVWVGEIEQSDYRDIDINDLLDEIQKTLNRYLA